MPVRFVTSEQERRYGKFTDKLSPEQLACYFHLDDTDREFLRSFRESYMRFGVAVQIGTVRFLGTFLENITDTPKTVQDYVADQLGISAGQGLLRYQSSVVMKRRHAIAIREKYGYALFATPEIQFRFYRWLYAICWTGVDRPGVVFDRSVAWLLDHKILLPGISTLERSIARLRSRVDERFWQKLAAGVTEEKQHQLEQLLLVSPDNRQSTLDRLRKGPTLTSPRELSRTIERLKEIQKIADGLPSLEKLPETRINILARYVATSKVTAIARLPDERRIAALIAFIHTLSATAYDDVMDLYEIVVNDMFRKAGQNNRKARLRTLKDLDVAALLLSEVGSTILNESISDDTLRHEIFDRYSRAELEKAVQQVESLANPDKDMHFKELRQEGKRLGFLSGLVKALPFEALPAGQPIVEAAKYLRDVSDGRKRRGIAPLAFVPKKWQSQVKQPDGSIDLLGYKLCFLDRLKHNVGKRDVFIASSTRYGDIRKGLFDGAAWEAVRPNYCRTVGILANGEKQVMLLSQQLDEMYHKVTAEMPQNQALRFENGELVLSPLDELKEPQSLLALREEIATLMPAVQIPEMLLEINTLTGFASEFNHVSEVEARAANIEVSVCGVLVAEALNIGIEPIIKQEILALRRSRLSWVMQNYMRADTYSSANAVLVQKQDTIPLARHWGNKEVASADGMRLLVPVKTIHAGHNSNYFGRRERCATWYNLLSNQLTGLNAIVIPGTLRDSLYLLAVVLEQETHFDPKEIMTDTAGYTDIIFAIFWLLGYQFSPRLADIGAQRFWRVDPKAYYGPFNDMGNHRIKIALITQHWDEFLRLAASLKQGKVKATNLMRTLQTKERPSKLALALQELGRLIKTLYLLRYVSDEEYRRRILTQLNKGESRHALARHFFYGHRGELRQRYREGQEDQLGALGLVTNAAVLWNTIYMDAAVNQLEKSGYPVQEEDKARLSPLMKQPFNVLGQFAFTVPDYVNEGKLRPLIKKNNILEVSD